MRAFRRQPELATGRIEAFADGVFAIAITLLVLEIGVPHLAEGESMLDALGDSGPPCSGTSSGSG